MGISRMRCAAFRIVWFSLGNTASASTRHSSVVAGPSVGYALRSVRRTGERLQLACCVVV